MNIEKVRKRVRPDCPNTAKCDAFLERPIKVVRQGVKSVIFTFRCSGMKLALMVQMCIKNNSF
jgi:hypothetical protein